MPDVKMWILDKSELARYIFNATCRITNVNMLIGLSK